MDELFKCAIMASPASSGKKGYCVHTFCQTNEKSQKYCPKYGDECTSGSLSGECTKPGLQVNHVCKYDPALVLAICGK